MKSRVVSNRVFSFVIIGAILISLFSFSDAFAAQTVNDRRIINSTSIPGDLADGDLFGYQIESIGDLDGDGVIDLATIKFSDDSGATDVGSILILFMNSDGTVKGTNEITMTDDANGIGNTCFDDIGNQRDTGSLEQLAFVGDLDNDGMPTLALGAPSNNHNGITDSGAVYMLELDSDGTVDTCFTIVPSISSSTTGFNPPDENYLETFDGFFGWPLIATDLNGDGQNELIVGASDETDATTNLWVLFLNSTGGVASHPLTPILGVTDIEITPNILDRDYISDGDTIDGGTKIVIGVEEGDDTPGNTSGDEVGAIHIINLTPTGAFSSSTQILGISLGQGISGDSEAFGRGVTAIGDMDNDGVDDIMVGNKAGDDTETNSGEVYILYLNSDDTVKESQKISNISENARTGSAPFGALDLFGQGMNVWLSSSTEIVIAISATEDDDGGSNRGAIHLFYIEITPSPVTNGGGSGSNEHQSRPTFGKDHHTFVQRVQNGLVINNQAFTITNNFHTDFEMYNVTVGVPQNFTATVYAPHQLFVMEFLFGISELREWNNAEASVAFFFDYAGELQDIEFKNRGLQPMINFENMTYSFGPALCVPDDNKEFCKKVSVELVFNEESIGNIFALQAIDHKRRSQVTYLNDGIEINGESLNPPLHKQIISEIRNQGLQTIERIDKEQDIWMSLNHKEPVFLYQQNSFGTFIPIEYRVFEKIADPVRSVMEREHSYFDDVVKYEQLRAVEQFDASLLQKEIGPSFSYEYPLPYDRIEKLWDIIEAERMRAQQTIEIKYTHDERGVQHLTEEPKQ